MKFEYKIYHIDPTYPDKEMAGLNELGEKGWEVISTILIRERTIFILLKRSVPEYNYEYKEGISVAFKKRSIPEDV